MIGGSSGGQAKPAEREPRFPVGRRKTRFHPNPTPTSPQPHPNPTPTPHQRVRPARPARFVVSPPARQPGLDDGPPGQDPPDPDREGGFEGGQGAVGVVEFEGSDEAQVGDLG